MNRSEIIILLIAAIISVVKWVMERGKEEGPSEAEEEHRRRLSEMRREKSGESPGTPAANAEEERLRKFMEALGLPPSAPPPTPVRKPAAASPRSEQTQPPPTPGAPSRPVISVPAPAPRRAAEPVIIRNAGPTAPAHPPALPHPPILPASPSTSPITSSAEADAAEAAAFAIRTSHLRQPRQHASIGEEPERLVNFSSRRALRSAFVMSEILGKPKGLG